MSEVRRVFSTQGMTIRGMTNGSEAWLSFQVHRPGHMVDSIPSECVDAKTAAEMLKACADWLATATQQGRPDQSPHPGEPQPEAESPETPDATTAFVVQTHLSPQERATFLQPLRQ